MFEGNLYNIKELNITDDTINAKISLNSNHEIFKGHFPDMPILPGVCTLQIIKELTYKFVNKNITLVKGDNIKFTAIINPNENKNILFDIKILSNTNEFVTINCIVSNSTIVVLKMKGTYSCSKENN